MGKKLRKAQSKMALYAYWLLKDASERLDEYQLEEVAECAPQAALIYASEKISDDKFSAAVEKCPWIALQFAEARMTDDQFIRAACEYPRVAYQYQPDRTKRLLTGRDGFAQKQGGAGTIQV